MIQDFSEKFLFTKLRILNFVNKNFQILKIDIQFLHTQ